MKLRQQLRATKTGIAAGCLLVSTTIAAELPQLGKSPMKSVIAALTLEEKAQVVIGSGLNMPGVLLPGDLQAPVIGSVSGGVVGAAGTTHAVAGSGIPSIVLADGPAGLRIDPRREGDSRRYYATAFPIASLLASTWDTALVEAVGGAMGEEAKAFGVDVLLAPAMNIHRYPLGGRNFEYFSEDPLLSGKMAAAVVRGVQSQGVGTSVKHFVANNHEWNRAVLDVKVGERALREIYLKGFEIAVKEGKPWTVMSSYNQLNGVYTSQEARLLTDILRKQWGFDGLVMTDWFGGRDPVAQMRAGNDLLMPGTQKQVETLVDAVKSGVLDESVLDRNAAAVLNVVVRTLSFQHYQHTDQPNLAEHAALVRRAAAQGMVLLQNQKEALPLPAVAKIALFGNSAYEPIIGGSGSGDVNEAYAISLPRGLVEAGFAVNQGLKQTYESYLAAAKAGQPEPTMFAPAVPPAERDISLDEITAAARVADLALFALGRNSGEGVDRRAENDFYLSTTEKALLENIAKVFHQQQKKVVVILNVGGVVETASWRDTVDGILLAWQPGQEAGYAVADVLAGAVNPSGKLPTTFSLGLEDYPAAKNFPGRVLEPGDPQQRNLLLGDKAAEVDYTDDIWVGYRYFNSKGVDTAYPFGYGLSYTSFEFSDLKMDGGMVDGHISAVVKVKNTGRRAGKEVVQLYVAAPPGDQEKPAAELRGFAKTGLLQPGESQTLRFVLSDKDLASFDEQRNNWIVAKGKYTVMLGASSRDIRQTGIFNVGTTRHFPP